MAIFSSIPGTNPSPTFDPLRNVFCTSKRYMVPVFYVSFSREFCGIFAQFSPRYTHLIALTLSKKKQRNDDGPRTRIDDGKQEKFECVCGFGSALTILTHASLKRNKNPEVLTFLTRGSTRGDFRSVSTTNLFLECMLLY